jgi:tetratricopeptide (TPR) repeat protein
MDRLRALWDFADLDGSEHRLREQEALERSGPGRAEVLAQLARVEGLRGRIEEGERLLRSAEPLAAGSAIAAARIELERGRLLRSNGSPEAAYPHFESAVELALEAGEHFVAADAAHMAALTAPGREEYDARTGRGIALAEEHEGASYWLGPLLNNLGWKRYDAGEYGAALDAFRKALEARERDPDRPKEIAIAHYAVARALQALGRHHDAVDELERSLPAWAESGEAPDGWYHEALAESCGPLGRLSEAREHASLALSLLPATDPAFEDDADRVRRLQALVETS